jgi:hypothetical protein
MKLYHYLSSNHALSNINRRRIKISKLDELNDPFELVAANHSEKDQRNILNGWKETMAKKWGILCFSRTWKNPVMWSHYADRHKGMCLGFEVSNEVTMPVKYTKNRLNVDIEELHDRGMLDKRVMDRLLKTKYVDWNYEREVRVYSSIKDKYEQTGLFFYPFDEKLRLAEIIAGPLCEISENEIKKNLSEKDLGVKIVKSRLAFKTFSDVEQQRGFAK